MCSNQDTTSHEPGVLAMPCVQGTREGIVLMPCRPSHLKTRLPCLVRCLARRDVQEGIPSMSSLQAMPRHLAGVLLMPSYNTSVMTTWSWLASKATARHAQSTAQLPYRMLRVA